MSLLHNRIIYVREGGAANFRGAPDIFTAVGSLLKSFSSGFLLLRKKLRRAN